MKITDPLGRLRRFAHCILTWLCFICVGATTCANAKTQVAITPAAIPQHNSVILLYHHVSDRTPKSTSVTPEMFAQHMAYLSKHHTVIPLTKAINALQQGTPLPENSVVITFDDGYANILHNAHPILAKYGFPYTIFINPQEIGSSAQQLSWEQVTAMHNNGVTFANHTLDHIHMLDNQHAGDNWLAKVWNNVEAAEASIASHIGQSHKYLAYPFGEFNSTLANKVKAEGYIGFGQHSGAIGPYSDFRALPRFPAAGPYAKLSTLKTKLNSLAMPVVDNSITNPEMRNNKESVSATLKISGNDVNLDQANCFFGAKTLDTETSKTQLSFTLDTPLPVGRSRVNCTAPSFAHPGRYYWYSQPFFVADRNGEYPD